MSVSAESSEDDAGKIVRQPEIDNGCDAFLLQLAIKNKIPEQRPHDGPAVARVLKFFDNTKIRTQVMRALHKLARAVEADDGV
jgi:hypothetical protein